MISKKIFRIFVSCFIITQSFSLVYPSYNFCPKGFCGELAKIYGQNSFRNHDYENEDAEMPIRDKFTGLNSDRYSQRGLNPAYSEGAPLFNANQSISRYSNSFENRIFLTNIINKYKNIFRSILND